MIDKGIDTMPLQFQINDYYGYNSIINSEGKRIRRMRRTEASAQKLHLQKVRSPVLSRSASSRRSRISQNQKCSVSGSINQYDSSFKFCRQKIPNSNIQKQSQSFHSVSNFNSEKSKKIPEAQPKNIEEPFKNIKQAMGEYYIGSQAKWTQRSAKQLLKNNRSIQKIKDSQYMQSSLLHSKVGSLTANASSRRTLKKTQKSHQYIKPFQLQQKINRANKNQLDDRGQACLLKKRQSNIQQKSPKSNSKYQISKNSQISESNIENKELNIKKISRKNHVNFEQSVLSSKKSDEIKNDYGINDNYSERLSSLRGSKKSSVKIDMPSQISNSSQDCSRQSSYASKLRSKIKDKQQKSKLSSVNQLFQEEEKPIAPKSKIKITAMTKKSTQTTESNKSHQNSHQKIAKKVNYQVNELLKNSKFSLKKISTLGSEEKNPITNTNPEKDISQSENESSFYSSSSQIKNSIKQANDLKNAKFSIQNQNLKVMKKKSVSSYTFNDVVQNIEEHQIRICSLYLFVDSTKALYETPLKFQRYERLCFLMLKKYKYQKNRIIESIQGCESCFTLMDAQIPTEVLQKHLNRQEVRQRLSTFIQEGKKISYEHEDVYNRICKKYQKDKYIKMECARDNFSPQIMRLLMEQLTKLYQQLQRQDIQNDIIDSNQQRIIEIVQIMFLISELSGRFVKKFQLFQEIQIDFEEYYSQNYERIMETAQYFQKYV